MASDKHMDTARELALSSEGIYRPAEFEALARDIAAALEAAEREGMKRATEIVRAVASGVRDGAVNGMEHAVANAIDTAAGAILPDHPHSSDALLPVETNKAGEVPPPISSATPSYWPDDAIPSIKSEDA